MPDILRQVLLCFLRGFNTCMRLITLRYREVQDYRGNSDASSAKFPVFELDQETCDSEAVSISRALSILGDEDKSVLDTGVTFILDNNLLCWCFSFGKFLPLILLKRAKELEEKMVLVFRKPCSRKPLESSLNVQNLFPASLEKQFSEIDLLVPDRLW
ncbi:hypothetical protein HAX54_032515 [Datura stramonium]|uniref:Uncharacterized protein n=1 Tax=Datura stramonium TaxID=4076 RepID=A0ABS8VCA7_DATST|nr:hypothetical protein [Datura stramonium]